MGLSASQARLLSLTSRISQNELRSEQVTRSKQALAQETADLAKKYVNSLNANELTYAIYDQDGEKTCMELTGAALSQYAPLKNQYALVNAHGQVLVSELDAGNYEKSADINEFLACYGIDPIPTGETRTVKNPGYDAVYDAWKAAHDEWLANKPDEKIITEISPAYDEEIKNKDGELYKKFLDASGPCRRAALSGIDGAGCYCHVLAHLVHLQTTGGGIADSSKYPLEYSTSVDGLTVSWGEGLINASNICSNGKTESMVEISKAVCDNYKGKTLMATPNSEFVSRFDLTDADYTTMNPSDPDYAKRRLLSNYTFDENGHAVLKTLEQKCIDMMAILYDFSNLGIHYNPDLVDLLLSFEEDMSLADTEIVHHDAVYEEEDNPAYQEWLEGEPIMEDIPATIEEEVYTYSDNDEAQWYVNLWHRMNGESQEKDGYTTNQFGTTVSAMNGYFTNQKRWDILEDGLMNNAKWLKYALETGAVTIERVEFADPNEMGTGIRKTKWNSIIYTNAADIGTQTNQKIAAQAEAEFDRKQKALTSKDKQYDSILKLLDTEHNTLLQEYETAKSVVTKNTERTLKLYS